MVRLCQAVLIQAHQPVHSPGPPCSCLMFGERCWALVNFGPRKSPIYLPAPHGELWDLRFLDVWSTSHELWCACHQMNFGELGYTSFWEPPYHVLESCAGLFQLVPICPHMNQDACPYMSMQRVGSSLSLARCCNKRCSAVGSAWRLRPFICTLLSSYWSSFIHNHSCIIIH